ncbi:hypothetical protein ACJX0J_032278 [Zea mays]
MLFYSLIEKIQHFELKSKYPLDFEYKLTIISLYMKFNWELRFIVEYIGTLVGTLDVGLVITIYCIFIMIHVVIFLENRIGPISRATIIIGLYHAIILSNPTLQIYFYPRMG